MRQLIIERINQLGYLHNGYSPLLARWAHIKINGVHISEVNFNDLTDEDLLKAFEVIIDRNKS